MNLLKLSIQIPYKLAGTAGNAHVNGNLYGQGVRFPRRTYRAIAMTSYKLRNFNERPFWCTA